MIRQNLVHLGQAGLLAAGTVVGFAALGDLQLTFASLGVAAVLWGALYFVMTPRRDDK
jgi:hypothetical protein